MSHRPLLRMECDVCGYVYDEQKEAAGWDDLPDDWTCPVCGAGKSEFVILASPARTESEPGPDAAQDAPQPWASRTADDVERAMADIHSMAETGRSIIEPMRARNALVEWGDILILGAQLARLPLNRDEPVSTRTVIGKGAAKPMVLDTPVYVTHMSFGALSQEAQDAMARGAAEVGTAIGSGEGGVSPDTLAAAHRFIYEYVPNLYSLSDEMLQRADAVEIKIGQSAKPGMGGLLPGAKVTPEIAAVRGFPPGTDIHSPARFPGIRTAEHLREKVQELRSRSGGRPIGIKIAAGRIEADIEFALKAGPDFITVDGRAGGTGAAPKVIKAACSVPTIYALHRARACLDRLGASHVSLVITGGLRLSSDFAKALAMGADAVAIGTAAMMACGCRQYRVCSQGRCPVGIATQDPELRARLDVAASARRVANFLRVCTEELRDFARLTGHDDVHALSVEDLCTLNSEISDHTSIPHAGRRP